MAFPSTVSFNKEDEEVHPPQDKKSVGLLNSKFLLNQINESNIVDEFLANLPPAAVSTPHSKENIDEDYQEPARLNLKLGAADEGLTNGSACQQDKDSESYSIVNEEKTAPSPGKILA